ncbi:MAG: carbohydrate kinase [Eubacteriaceae bacterium]|nr:carbohydrate kinase [Eubacteriaceae bacterium]
MDDKKQYDAVSLGEALIDFIGIGPTKYGMQAFERNPGGAVANAIVAMSRYKLKTAFLGKVGNDMHGRFLKSTLEEAGVDTSAMILSDEYFTTLAFVGLDEEGERSFSFARKPGADMMLEWSEISKPILESTKLLHVGSISLTNEPAKSAQIESVLYAKRHGALISYDPNYRDSLWSSESEAEQAMRLMLGYADIVKASEEEILMLAGATDPDKAADALLEQGARLVAITLGSKGALLATKKARASHEAYKVDVVDTTGAGDAFLGGLLYKANQAGLDIEGFGEDTLAGFAKFANATAAICISRRGAIPSMPTLDDTIAFIEDKE